MDEHEIKTIRDQFHAQQWPKWLTSVTIDGLRGWTGQTVTFRFPVTAIVGENGTGKTTVLRVAACAYDAPPETTKEFFPPSLFVETQWDQIAGVKLHFGTRQGDKTESFGINKPTERWRYPERRPTRAVFFFDIGRILPIEATVGYAKVAKQRAAEEISTNDLSEEFRTPLSYILGRTYSKARFVRTKAAEEKPVGLLAREFGEISP